MSPRRLLALALAVSGISLGVAACGDSEYDPPAETPVVEPVNLPPGNAIVYRFKVTLDNTLHECVAFDGGNNGGMLCTPIGVPK